MLCINQYQGMMDITGSEEAVLHLRKPPPTTTTAKQRDPAPWSVIDCSGWRVLYLYVYSVCSIYVSSL